MKPIRKLNIIQTHEPAGVVLQYDHVKKMMRIGVRNHLAAGDEVELLLPDDIIQIDTRILIDANGKSASKKPIMIIRFICLWSGKLPIGALLRQKVK
ncbi:MAG: U32 family peptidase C-terminal domain-containing protein [Desulfobacterales bacterium]|nr:U32 family peptidase C-terminal domain-containing protein [Desulfobacterales bacterium]